MASMQSESGQIIYAGSNFLHPFQLHFSKEGMDHCVQNQPRSNLDGLVRVWPDASGPEASWCAGMIRTFSGRMQPACYQTRFHSSTDVPDNIVQNQPKSDLVLADCVRFGPNRSGPEASGVQESSSPLLVNASQPIWTGRESDPACLLRTC